MSNFEDRSDTIARLRVYFESLSELEPDGMWQHEPLIWKWKRSPYHLRMSEIRKLENYLHTEIKRIHAAAAAKHYEQLNLLEHTSND